MNIFTVPIVKVCRECQGRGKIVVKVKNPSYTGVNEYYQQPCPRCQGKGTL